MMNKICWGSSEPIIKLGEKVFVQVDETIFWAWVISVSFEHSEVQLKFYDNGKLVTKNADIREVVHLNMEIQRKEQLKKLIQLLCEKYRDSGVNSSPEKVQDNDLSLENELTEKLMKINESLLEQSFCESFYTAKISVHDEDSDGSQGQSDEEETIIIVSGSSTPTEIIPENELSLCTLFFNMELEEKEEEVPEKKENWDDSTQICSRYLKMDVNYEILILQELLKEDHNELKSLVRVVSRLEKLVEHISG